MYKAKIKILLKDSILDPQGQAVQKSFQTLNEHEVEQIRIGRYIELKINTTDLNYAREKVKKYCDIALVNPVIEYYKFELESSEA